MNVAQCQYVDINAGNQPDGYIWCICWYTHMISQHH